MQLSSPSFILHPRLALLLSLGMLWVAVPAVYGRLMIDVSGVVIDAQHGTSYGRPHTYYTVRKANGEVTTFISGPSDASLHEIPIGAEVEKKKWDIGYSLDHIYQLRFPLHFYGGLVVVAIVLIGYASLQWIKERR